MARPPKGKALTLRPIRLDDDVWAECQRLGKEHGTINEGLRGVLFHPWEVATVTEKHWRTGRTFKGPLLKPKDRK